MEGNENSLLKNKNLTVSRDLHLIVAPAPSPVKKEIRRSGYKSRAARGTIISLFVIPVPADQIFLISWIRSLKIPLAGHARSSALLRKVSGIALWSGGGVRHGRGDLK